MALRRRKHLLRGALPIAPRASGLALRLACAAAAAIAGTVLTAGHASAAAPIACGGIYTAATGDTLFRIADRAYGDGWKYKLVFAANRDQLRNAESLEVGNQILIPCQDGSGPATRADALALGMIADAADPIATEPLASGAEVAETPAETPAEAQAATPAGKPAGTQAGLPGGKLARAASDAEHDDRGTFLQAAARLAVQAILPGQGIVDSASTGWDSAPAEQPIRFVIGSGFAPFADQALPRGGIVTDLVALAFETAAPERTYRVSFATDWDARADALLPSGAFEIGFPWFRPDCGQPSGLGEARQRLCDGFVFSKPIQAVQVGYFTRHDDPLAAQSSLGALSGKRLCVPQGRFALEIVRMGLVAPDVALETEPTAERCFNRLAAGEVDAVTSLKSDNDASEGLPGPVGSVVEIPGMRSTQFLYAIAPKSSPEALAAIDFVDLGISEVMRSGKWFEIVSTHLAEQAARPEGS